MANKQGWVCIHRKLQECDIWLADEPFDCRSAWIDLILTANHSSKSMMFDRHRIVIERGQILTSVRKLSARWGWSKDKTLNFLKLLEEYEMIKKESNSRRTLLTIENYDKYQSIQDSEKTLNGRSKDTEKTLNGHCPDTDSPQTTMYNNDVNNLNNENNVNKEDNMSARADAPTVEDVREVIRLYNLYCVSMPECQKLTDKRTKAIKTRLKKYSLDDFEKVFKLAEQSDFLTGRNGKWTNCNIDWLINENNMIKVFEGNYKNRDKDNLQSAYDTIDEWVNQMEAQNGV